MKKQWNLLIFCVFATMITYGSASNNQLTVISNKCTDNINLFCLLGYNNYPLLNNEIADNYTFRNYLDIKDTDTASLNPILLTLQINEEIKKTKSQEDHINRLLERKRSQYKLYKVNVLGQLTSPVNMKINYHKLQPPRMEGFGLRFRL